MTVERRALSSFRTPGISPMRYRAEGIRIGYTGAAQEPRGLQRGFESLALLLTRIEGKDPSRKVSLCASTRVSNPSPPDFAMNIHAAAHARDVGRHQKRPNSMATPTSSSGRYC